LVKQGILEIPELITEQLTAFQGKLPHIEGNTQIPKQSILQTTNLVKENIGY
jgi:hypothetical protein